MNAHSAEKDATCCACTGAPVARVVDGAYRKPVCATHRRLYAEKGYLIDALGPTRVTPPAEPDCDCGHAEADHYFTGGAFCNECGCECYVIPPGVGA